jgi:hypothetical protein
MHPLNYLFGGTLIAVALIFASYRNWIGAVICLVLAGLLIFHRRSRSRRERGEVGSGWPGGHSGGFGGDD